MVLTKDAILSAKDTKVEKVDVPEWGGCLYVRTLSAADALKLSVAQADGDGLGKFAALVISNEQGEPLFNEADAAALMAKNHDVVSRIVAAAMKFNGLSKGEVEALEKN